MLCYGNHIVTVCLLTPAAYCLLTTPRKWLNVTGYCAFSESNQSGAVSVVSDFYRISHGIKVPRLTELFGTVHEIHCFKYTLRIWTEGGNKCGCYNFDAFYMLGWSHKHRLRYNIVILRKEGHMYRGIEDVHAKSVKKACRW